MLFRSSASEGLAREMADAGVSSAADLALRYVASIEGVSALSGMTSAAEAEANCATLSQPLFGEEQAEALRLRFESLIQNAEYVCTGCRYCLPCSEELDIPGILRLRNYHVVLQLESAQREFRHRYRHDEKFRADKCTECGLCEGRCPNQLPVASLMKEVMATLAEAV